MEEDFLSSSYIRDARRVHIGRNGSPASGSSLVGAAIIDLAGGMGAARDALTHPSPSSLLFKVERVYRSHSVGDRTQ